VMERLSETAQLAKRASATTERRAWHAACSLRSATES
jgi:hypothetical protein